MILYVYKDILKETEIQVIAHQVNCFTMGSGLAKQIYTKYSVVKKEHKELVDSFSDNRKALLGKVQYIKVEDNLFIANCFAQYDYGRENKLYTDYNAFAECLIDLSNFMKKNNYTLGIPYNIGCGLGNGNWQVVELMIIGAFCDLEQDVFVCKL